ncbi:acetyl-CoA carboxylase biotin carboxyl carrier protein [Parvularcula sp. ZS-1/3]|uniref:Biotin carboxyl carrier protein of acetyl-CoA carboxylase n=1 Tax=Parvularcula mediterranea TaxID=2732508 RepID=A0A7Y3W424_9PROT|nr:acetyl-CoA carboxylase biotin carboxyl carrier protein [Parvularcula mediterranea]NNU15038.1 acetyl-CoA carboxylase biotin carboxyl carrier protein [Parvularcula mediterranea]
MAKSLDEDLEIVRELANVLNDTGMTEVELERGGLKLRVAKQVQQTVIEAPQAAPMMAAAPAAPQAAAPAAAAPAALPSSGEAVRSPMVGTAYLSPSPGADEFIAVGATVKAGQTLMIVEAMKTMNEIKSPRDGKVVEILARNAEPVEYDEPLVILEA